MAGLPRLFMVHVREVTGAWRAGGRLGGQASFASMHAVGMCRTVREWAVPGFSRSVWVGFSLSEYNYTATNYNQPLPQALQ